MTFSNWCGQVAHLATFGLAFKPEPPPVLTPARVALQQLEKAQFDLLDHRFLAEYHNSMVVMLEDRVRRLREDVRTLSAESIAPPIPTTAQRTLP